MQLFVSRTLETSGLDPIWGIERRGASKSFPAEVKN